MFKICVLGCGEMSTSGHGPSFEKYFEDYKDVEQHKDVFAESADNIPESILSGYSVAVLNFNPENINISGDLRLTKYAWFLKENYFDPRGDLCNASGQAILRYVLGDKTQKNL